MLFSKLRSTGSFLKKNKKTVFALGTGVVILGSFAPVCLANSENEPKRVSIWESYFPGISQTFPMAAKKWHQLTGDGEDILLPPEKAVFYEVMESKINYKDLEDEIPKSYSPEALKMIELVKLKKERGEKSYHPWYPTNRALLDAYLLVWSKSFDPFYMHEFLPPKLPDPYGKKLTLVIDAHVFYNLESKQAQIDKMNRRPGTDLFLADIFPKYEIILIGSGKQNSKSWDYNPLVEVDESMALVSISLPHELKPHLPFFMFNSLKVLNRPAESTIIVTPFPENVVTNPNNAVIIKPFDENNDNDTSLSALYDFLEFAGKKMLSGTPADKICPSFQDINKDVVEIWQEKKKTTILK